jgi:hypothetical protein
MISHIIGTLSDKQVFGLICHNYINLLYFVKRAICKKVSYEYKNSLGKIDRESAPEYRGRFKELSIQTDPSIYLLLRKVIIYLYYLQTTNKLMIKSKYNVLFIICYLRGVSETLCSLLVVYLFFPFSHILKKFMLIMPASCFIGRSLDETTGSLNKGKPLLKMKPYFIIIKKLTESSERYNFTTSVPSGSGNELLELTKNRADDFEVYKSYYE